MIMKKVLIMVMVAALFICFAGCSKTSTTGGKLELKDNGDDTLNCVDTESSPLDGGLSITVDKSNGFVNFQITDKNGEDTVEFFKFTPADSTCHRYRYVSMMGTGFNYFFDYKAGTMIRIEDKDNADVTQSTKDQGRFESAQSETKEMVDKLIVYFEDTFGMTIDEAIQ